MTKTSIELNLKRAVLQLALLYILAVFAAAMAAVGVAAGQVFQVAVLSLTLSLIVPVWLVKIVLECITLTTVPLSEDDAQEAAKPKAPTMPPKSKDGMKLDARRR